MDDVRWLSGEEQAAWRSYLRGVRLVEVAMDRALAKHGVQLSEYEILVVLSETPGQAVRMSIVADHVVQSRSRVTHTASRLERRGWVERRMCVDDRRGVLLALTDEGRLAMDRLARVHVPSVRENVLDHLSGDEMLELGRAMQKIGDGIVESGAAEQRTVGGLVG